jgi:hypothetical protein
MNDLFSRIVRTTVSGTVVFLAIIFIPARELKCSLQPACASRHQISVAAPQSRLLIGDPHRSYLE